jgi:hypothetical protein
MTYFRLLLGTVLAVSAGAVAAQQGYTTARQCRRRAPAITASIATNMASKRRRFACTWTEWAKAYQRGASTAGSPPARRGTRPNNSTTRVKAYPMLPLKMLRVLRVEHRTFVRRAARQARAAGWADGLELQGSKRLFMELPEGRLAGPETQSDAEIEEGPGSPLHSHRQTVTGEVSRVRVVPILLI